MLRFCLCFLSFFYTVNSFSTEKKQEEEIKCYSCKKTIIKIEKEKNNKENYTAEAPFASLSCIFDCKCNSYFLCKSCYEKKKMDKCPKCKNKNNENNGYKGPSCGICLDPYIDIKLASCSYFYNCNCKDFICKECYNQWTQKSKEHTCPICKTGNNTKNNHYVINKRRRIFITMDMLPIAARGEIEDQKNCCQICTEYIKDFFIDC